MNNANENDKKNVFQERFRELVGDTATQEEIASIVNTSRQNVGNWLKGKSKPDINALAEIAKGYKVSTDWLLGLTDIKTSDTKIKDICEYIGLSEDTVKSFSEFKNDFDYEFQSECMSEIMETAEFKKIFSYIWQLEDIIFTEFYLRDVSIFFDKFAENNAFSIDLRNAFFKRFSNAFGFSAESIYADEEYRKNHYDEIKNENVIFAENFAISQLSKYFQIENEEEKNIYEYGAIKQFNKTVEKYISSKQSSYMTRALNQNKFVSGLNFDYTFASNEEEQSFRKYVLEGLNETFEDEANSK